MNRRSAVLVAVVVCVTVLGAVVIAATVSRSNVAPRFGSEPSGSGPVVAFYGDSYTAGDGASTPARRWSTLISAQRGWQEFNPSVGGLGFVNNREGLGALDLVDEIVEREPDIVISAMGLNDNFSMPDRAAEIRAAIEADFDRFARIPGARVIVIEPFWYHDERPASVEQIIGWVRDAAAAHNFEFVAGASAWLTGRPELIGPDGLHPNDRGYQVIAENMDRELAARGLPHSDK